MANQKFDLRQTQLRVALPMVGNAAGDLTPSILAKIDAQLAKLFEDRNSLLTDGGIITFTGAAVQFTESLKLSLNSKISGAAPQVIDLGSTTRNLSASGRMIVAVIDRTLGTAVITDDVTTLPAVTSANQEVFLIAKRVDATDGTQRIYFRNGAALNAGQSVRLGASGSGGAGTGTGDDVGVLTFKASFADGFDDIPTSANSAVDTTTGKTDATNYSAVSAMFQLSYDATKTVTTSGVNATMSAAPAFTVKVGDMLIAGGIARRIITVTSQTVYVVEAAFASNLTAAAATVSQTVYSKDLNNFAGDGLPVSSAFSTTINQLLMTYEDTTAQGDKIFDANTVPVIAFTASADGTNYTTVQQRKTLLNETIEITNLPTAGTNLFLRLFANKTTGSGTVNVLGYKVFFHRDLASLDGSMLSQAAILTNGLGGVNASASVVGGKTRIQKTWTYPVAVNPGTPNGALKVYVNGQKIPRFTSTTATPDASYREIDQRTIELDQDYSGLALLVEIIMDVAVVDVTDSNTTSISQVQEVAAIGFQSFVAPTQMAATTVVGAPAAGRFYSSIQNRASLVDMSMDLGVRFGIERSMTQTAMELETEFGPNGERVFAIANDPRVRLVGSGWVNQKDVNGSFPYGIGADDYVEITFYGTALNMLTYPNSVAGTDYRASVDGGAEGGNLVVLNGTVFQGRNYTSATVLPIVSGLALGVHTVKIRKNTVTGNSLNFQGYEVINTTANVAPGISYVNSKKLVSSASAVFSHNTGFETGIAGTRGARVVVYQKADGSIAKAVNPVSTQANFTAADHSNEETIRSISYREFGAGRSDDFSLLQTTGVNRTFTLEDGTTTLVGSAIGAYTIAPTASIGFDGIGFTSVNAFVQITFVGTGLDIVDHTVSNTTGTGTVLVDGIQIATYSQTPGNRVRKIVSGLPYGTHTVRIIAGVAGANSFNDYVISRFIVYQPKKPAIPAGAIELADYNLMANFAANTTVTNTTGRSDYMSTGVLRKSVLRELTLVEGTGGTVNWNLLGISAYNSGYALATNRNGAYVEYTFFGTGFDFRGQTYAGASSNVTIQVDGANLTAANFAGATFTTTGTNLTYGGTTGSNSTLPATNVMNLTWSGGTSEVSMAINGLSLGIHKVRFTNNTTAEFLIESLDIITPIHSAKLSAFEQQNTLPVGNIGISDNRKFTPVRDSAVQTKAFAQTSGVSFRPSTTSTVYVPMPDMSVSVKTSGGPLQITGFANIFPASGSNIYGRVIVFVNGMAVTPVQECYLIAADSKSVPINITLPVAAGTYNVTVYWNCNTGAVGALDYSRVLTVKEL